MSPLGFSFSCNLLSAEIHCSGCGNRGACHSRPRGFVEKQLLPVLMLKPVRCDHCFHRFYVRRSVPVSERPGPGLPPTNDPQSGSRAGTRVA